MQPAAPVVPVQPAAVVADPVQPVATERTISVKSGDSLWKLAQQNLGRGNRWHELLAVNPSIADPNQIRAGTNLVLPAAAAAGVDRSTRSDAAHTIKVHKGDTLWTLAKSNLGRSSAWPCLASANPSLRDPNHIYENQELFIPAGCRP